MKLEGAVFDLDGTLLDSMPAWNNAGPDYLRSLGIEPENNLGARVRKMSLYRRHAFFGTSMEYRKEPMKLWRVLIG